MLQSPFITESPQALFCACIIVVLYYLLNTIYLCLFHTLCTSSIIKTQSWCAGSLLHICFYSNSTYIIAPKIILVVHQVKGFSLCFRMKAKEVVKGNRLNRFPVEGNECMLWL